jgi:ectoine hydroxylase-related dioxygenase (phytanoyl-CoA dioxygenase family)
MIDIAATVSELVDGPGYAVIPGAFDPFSVLPVVSELVARHIEAGAMLCDGGWRPEVLHVPEVQELMLKPWVLELGRTLIGGQVGFGSLVPNFVPAGSPGMGAHVDYPYSVMDEVPPVRPVLCMQMLWYLEDVTEDLAPTAVVPGSQLRRSKPDSEGFWREAVPVLAKAGSLFVSHGGLWHATMPNRASRSRPAIISKYFPARARPPWNPFTAIPREFLPGMVELFYPGFNVPTPR